MFSTYFDMPLNEILNPKQKFKYLQNFCPALIGRSSDEIRAALRSIVHQAGLVEIDISETSLSIDHQVFETLLTSLKVHTSVVELMRSFAQPFP